MRRVWQVLIILVSACFCLAATADADTAAGLAAYERGDYPNAAALLRPEAERGDGNAEYRLGMMYLQAKGVDLEVLAARFWLARAAGHGHGHGEAMKAMTVLNRALADLFAKGPGRAEGGDGASQDRAILLPDAKTEAVGIRTEHAVVNFFFPGWTWKAQSGSIGSGNRKFDVVTLEKGGIEREIYFDITNWFGRWD